MNELEIRFQQDGRKAMPHSALAIEAIRQGFYLKQPDDHILELWYRGNKIASYSQQGVTIEALQHDISEEIKRNLN